MKYAWEGMPYRAADESKEHVEMDDHKGNENERKWGKEMN